MNQKLRKTLFAVACLAASACNGPHGTNGTSGADGGLRPRGIPGERGIRGNPGPQGDAGPQGAPGPAGSAVIVLSDTQREAASSACPAGGHRVRSGADVNGNGQLDSAEVQASTLVCNGEAGNAGQPGSAGQGVTATTTATAEPAGEHCEYGGTRVEVAVFADVPGDAGPPLSTSTFYTCNGAPGPQGARGDAGPQGIPGPQGSQGIPGPQGDAGAQGLPGISAEVATPAISPLAGATFEESVQVTLSVGTLGADIYYTTNGNDPTSSSTLYTGPVTLTASATLKAIGIKAGRTDSLIASETYDVFHIFRVGPSGSDLTGDGSANAPFASINAALNAASLNTDHIEVRVAPGTYAPASMLAVPAGVSVFGGYYNNWSYRTLDLFQTFIDASALQIAVWLGPGALIDGFIVDGGTSGLDPSGCFVLPNGGTVRNTTCTLNPTGNGASVGVYAAGGTTLIENNTITIHGSGLGSAAGVVSSALDLTLRRNIINVAYEGLNTFALNLGTEGTAAQAIRVYNNLLFETHDATAEEGDAIYVYSLTAGSEVLIANNTVRAGSNVISNVLYNGISVLAQEDTTRMTIVNNIVYCVNAATPNNLAVQVVDPGPLFALDSNNLFDCATGIFSDGTTTHTTAQAVNNLSYAPENISFDLVNGMNSYFMDETDNWHLRPGGPSDFTAVKIGGLSALAAVYAADLGGIGRTADGTRGWSMGAYEADY